MHSMQVEMWRLLDTPGATCWVTTITTSLVPDSTAPLEAMKRYVDSAMDIEDGIWFVRCFDTDTCQQWGGLFRLNSEPGSHWFIEGFADSGPSNAHDVTHWPPKKRRA